MSFRSTSLEQTTGFPLNLDESTLSAIEAGISLDRMLSPSTIGIHVLWRMVSGGNFADGGEFMGKLSQVPDTAGRFGDFGGRYVPETLTAALDELAAAYDQAQRDPAFQQELDDLLRNYVGRPSPLYHAKRLSEHAGGAQIYLKREDLNHTGAHKINNTLGQALLTLRMGKRRVIAETGAGQHGVATATACARFGLECVVYMGEEDIRRQKPNVFSMRLLGAEVRPVTQRIANAARCHQRSDARLDEFRADNALHSGIGGRPASVSAGSCAIFNRSSAAKRLNNSRDSSAGCPTWWSPASAAAAMRPECFIRW